MGREADTDRKGIKGRRERAVLSCLVCDLGTNLLIKARVSRGQEINLVTALCPRLLRMEWKRDV